jgi:hypothetical protein
MRLLSGVSIEPRHAVVRSAAIALVMLETTWTASRLWAAAPQGVVTLKVVKQTAGMASMPPEIRLLSAAEQWKVRRGLSWSGENLREVFFTLEPVRANAELPLVAVDAPGIVPLRVIVGKQDVPFTHQDATTTFTLVRDDRNAMLLSQVLPDPEGGLPIHVYHNWLIRQGGQFRGEPVPEVEVKAVLNYLVAAREALKLMGGTGPNDRKSFKGDITLLGFEVACARGHNDHPPHVHIMLWVPGYVGGEVPHFYMDAGGKIVRNGFGILRDEAGKYPDRAAVIAEKCKRKGDYGPGKSCRLYDLEGRLALQLTITPEGGLLLARDTGEPYLLIGDERGPGEAVLVKQDGKALVRAHVVDDAERGEMAVTVDHFRDGRTDRTFRQRLLYDPFTGNSRPDSPPAANR